MSSRNCALLLLFTIICLLFTSIVNPLSAHAAPLLLSNSDGQVQLSGHMEMLKDQTGSLSIHEVSSSAYNSRFSTIPSTLVAGFLQHGAIWLRFTVQRAVNAPEQWLFEIDPEMNDHLELYIPSSSGEYECRRGGGLLPFSQREIPYRHDVFRLNLSSAQSQTMYLKIVSTRTITASPIFWQHEAFQQKLISESLLHGMYIGVLFLTACITLIYWVRLLEPVHGFYLAYVLIFAFNFLNNGGYLHQYLWGDHIWFIPRAHRIDFLLIIPINAGLLSHMLDLETRLPRFNRYTRNICVGIAVVGTVVAFTPFYPKLVLPSLILLFGSFCLSIAISIWFVKQVPGAGLYLAAFGVLMLLIVKRVLTAFGIISDSAIYNNILMFSSLIHILVLNIAIINKAVRNRKEINSAEAAYNSERIVVEQQRQFLRTMSHELRTPLSIIDCTAQILPVLRNDQDKFDKKTSAIRTAAKRMKTILDSNLTNERISLDGFVPNMQVVDLRSLIRNAVSKVNDGTDSHQVQYVLEMFPESFVCDPLLMEILIGNLLDNAVKYSPDEGCITLNSWIGSEKYLYIEITDHGVGISSEHIGLIFNRFYRTGQLPDVTGAGLGLYLAQQIAQQHGGDIACFSVPGKGSTFTVRLWYNC